MSKSKRAQYTLEFKIEAVRLVRGGQSVGAVSQVLGVAAQTLHNWVKREAQGQLRGSSGKPVSPEQMEISRLRAELARTSTPGLSATGGAGRCRCSVKCSG